MATWSDHCTEIVDKIQRQIMTCTGSIYLIVLSFLLAVCVYYEWTLKLKKNILETADRKINPDELHSTAVFNEISGLQDQTFMSHS